MMIDYFFCLYIKYLLFYCEFWICFIGVGKYLKYICLFVNLIIIFMNLLDLYVYDKWCCVIDIF